MIVFVADLSENKFVVVRTRGVAWVPSSLRRDPREGSTAQVRRFDNRYHPVLRSQFKLKKISNGPLAHQPLAMVWIGTDFLS